jgi:hypothetical protein
MPAQAFAFDEISSTLLALKSGRPATIPHYDFVTSSRVGSGTVVGNAGVVLVRASQAPSPKCSVFIPSCACARLLLRYILLGVTSKTTL